MACHTFWRVPPVFIEQGEERFVATGFGDLLSGSSQQGEERFVATGFGDCLLCSSQQGGERFVAKDVGDFLSIHRDRGKNGLLPQVLAISFWVHRNRGKNVLLPHVYALRPSVGGASLTAASGRFHVRAFRIKCSGFRRDLRGSSSTVTAATNHAAQLGAGLLGEGCPTASMESTSHWGVRLRDGQRGGAASRTGSCACSGHSMCPRCSERLGPAMVWTGARLVLDTQRVRIAPCNLVEIRYWLDRAPGRNTRVSALL